MILRKPFFGTVFLFSEVARVLDLPIRFIPAEKSAKDTNRREAEEISTPGLFGFAVSEEQKCVGRQSSRLIGCVFV